METLKLKLQNFLSKNNFKIVCFLSIILACLSMCVSNYFSYIYFLIIFICSLFYDVNKMAVLCFISIFGIQALHSFGLIQFIVSFSVICARKILVEKKKLDKTYIFPFVVLIIIATMFFCVNFQLKNWKSIAQVVGTIALSIEIYFLREDFKLDKIIKYSCYLLLLMCALSFLSLLIKTNAKIFNIDMKNVYRFRGLSSHENSLAIFAILYMAFYLFLFFKNKIGPVEFYFVEIILAIFGFMTKSKMFLVLLIVLLIFYFIKVFIKNWRNGLIQFCVLGFFACVFSLIFKDKVIELINRFTDYYAETDLINMLTTGRLDIWKHYLKLWAKTPLTIIFGIGGSYQDSAMNFSHNQYVEILSKYGIVGFGLVLSLVAYYILITKKEKKRPLENYVLIIVVALICLVGLLDSSLAGIILLALSILCLNHAESRILHEEKIPKTIHYVWFGKNDLPQKTQKLISGWKAKMPNYNFVLWNEENFDLASAPKYVKQAYESKKYAFVADYVRLYALYEQGGIYLDTDVEILKPFDELLNNKLFVGREDCVYLSTSVIGATKGNKTIEDFLKTYENKQFKDEKGKLNLTTNVEILSHYLKNVYDYDFVNSEQHFEGLTIYKREFFSPKNYITNKLMNTREGFSIHQFDASWEDKDGKKLKNFFIRLLAKLPVSLSNVIIDEYKKLKFFIKG